MEKGFNDEELADIMSEIESLEKEFSADDNGGPAAEAEQNIDVDQVSDVVATKSSEPPKSIDPAEQAKSKTDLQEAIDSEVSGVLGQLADQPEEVSVPIETQAAAPAAPAPEIEIDEPAPSENVHPIQPKSDAAPRPSGSAQPSKMSFHVEGEMEMELNFQIGPNEVSLSISEENGFVIALDSGATFTVPLADHSKKNAA